MEGFILKLFRLLFYCNLVRVAFVGRLYGL